MIISKDIDSIIWRYIHYAKVKSLNTEYLQSVYKHCDIYPNETTCTYLCTHPTYYSNSEYNWRDIYFVIYINIYNRTRCNTGRLPYNY